MNKKAVYIALIIVCVLAASYGCKHEQIKAEENPRHTYTVNGSVREINIWLETIDFPAHEGRGEFMSYCSMCHSLKYITMQPDFPRKVWEAEVTKMIVKYTAPIDSVTGKKIVDYIMMAKPVLAKGVRTQQQKI